MSRYAVPISKGRSFRDSVGESAWKVAWLGRILIGGEAPAEWRRETDILNTVMEFPFFNGKRKLSDTLIVIDLGGRTTKAVQVQHKNGAYSLLSYAVQDAPISEKAPSAELLSEHFKSVRTRLNGWY